MASGALLGPAGGLRYHGRAVRYRARLWAGFREALRTWLEAWQPPENALLLVGPSAGWCLPAEWLARFANVDALEPDPIARRLFARRFPALRKRLEWHSRDYLGPAGAGPTSLRLDDLVRDFPGRAVLFCNLLGQIVFLHPETSAPAPEEWKTQLARALAGQSWATFHDRLSGECAPRLEGLSAMVAGPLSDAELARRFYPDGAEDGVELVTHETGGLFAAHPRWYLAWQIVPSWFHLIEAIASPTPEIAP